jgi:Zn-dependent M28 family amino/carboxypeptidase
MLASAITVVLLAPAVAVLAADLPTFDPHRLSQEVRPLSSDAVQGRGPATPAETKTVDYLIEQYKAAGLEPGGAIVDGKRSWTQPVPLGRFEIVGTPRFSLTEKGNNVPLTQGEQIAVRASMDGTRKVDIEHAPLVFVGYGVKAPERHWDDFKGVDLKGKIGVVLVNDPDFESGQGDFGGKAMTYYGRWTYKYEEAARQGALGMLVVHETAPASYGWATVKNSNTNVQFDIVRDKPSAEHPTLEGWIQRDLAVQMFKAAGLDFDALKKQAQTRGFKPVTLRGVTLSANYDVDARVITSQNVVGRIEGARRPDETVIYSAHWDHLGVGAPDAKGDRIYNGAVDNATGTAALIEMGRAFGKGPKPDRSIVFMSVTAEEKGLLGTEYYAANPLYPLATTVADINIDMLPLSGPTKDIPIFGKGQNDLEDRLEALAAPLGRYVSDDHMPEEGFYYRSDHFPFARMGVPAIMPWHGWDWVDGGLEAGEAAWRAKFAADYHQASDEWSADWNLTSAVENLTLLYHLGYDLANSGDWPGWKPTSEFAQVRARSDAARQ